MVGQTLSQFEITAKLGAGGLAEVYRRYQRMRLSRLLLLPFGLLRTVAVLCAGTSLTQELATVAAAYLEP